MYSAKLVTALEEGDLEHEKIAHKVASELLHERASSGSRSTCSNDIIHNQDLLAGLDGTLLHLEEILAIFLLVRGRDTRAGELALLADGDEAGVELQGELGTEEEATSVQAYDDIRLGAKLENLELESAEEGPVGGGVLEDGQNVDEVDAGDGEVGEATQGGEQVYLCTGEFGGTGGGGGGLSSRGILRGGSLAAGQDSGFGCGEGSWLFGAGRDLRRRLVVGGRGHVGGRKRGGREGEKKRLSLSLSRNLG